MAVRALKSNGLSILLCLAPPLFIFAMQQYYAPSFPMLDQWELVPLLQRWHEGTIGWGDFFAQHNEHRPLFPRLIVLPVVLLSDWDQRWEPFLTLLCACGTFAMLYRMLPARSHAAAAFLLSTLVFSAVQWQNWLLGWQFQLMFGQAFAVAALLLLATRRGAYIPGMAAMVCAILSTFSFASGLLLWPLGLLLLLGQRRWGFAWSWGVASVAVFTAYFVTFELPAQHDAPGLRDDSGAYFFAYLGAPIFPYHATGAAVIGGIGLAMAIAVLVGIPNSPRAGVGIIASGEPRPSFPPIRVLLGPEKSPWIALALYAIGSAAITALARGHEGYEQALSSRYCTMAILLWVAILGEGCRQLLSRGHVHALNVCCLGSALIVCAASLFGAYRWSEHANAYATAREPLLELRPAPELRWVYPDEGLLLKRAEWLKAQGFAPYR